LDFVLASTVFLENVEGVTFIGETGRPLGVWIREHMNNFKQGLMEIQVS
jgi:hypothetical protein